MGEKWRLLQILGWVAGWVVAGWVLPRLRPRLSEKVIEYDALVWML